MEPPRVTGYDGPVTARAQPAAPRARTLAGAFAVALGLHAYAAMIALPGALVGALSRAEFAVTAIAPLLLLAGAWRRSDILLLLGFPAALLASLALAPELAAAGTYDPVRLLTASVSLVGYLLAAAAYCAREVPPPEASRPLAEHGPPPPRWRRRLRLYRGLAALTVAFPVAFVYAIHVDPRNRAYLDALHGDRADALTALLSLGAIATWLWLFAYVFLDILRRHRRGDRALRVRLASLRGAAKRPSRLRLTLGTAAAVALAVALWVARAS